MATDESFLGPAGMPFFNNAESVYIDGKEVQSIVVKDTGGILFQKSNDIVDSPVMTLTVIGSSFSTNSSTPFTYNGRVFVDWGDNTGLVEYTGGELSYSFTDENSNHTIKLYGDITSLGDSCFSNCTGLTSINIPDNVTSLGARCFQDCSSLASINIPNNVTLLGGYTFYGCTSLNDYYLNWTSSSTIIAYDSNKMPNNTDTIFHIPYGTTQLYIDKGYPSNKLEEEIPFNNIELSTDKSVLSSYHNDSCTLTAQLMHDSTPINLAGVTVTFSVADHISGDRYELDTVQTNASGVATMTYSGTKIEYLDIYEDMIATAEGFDSNICEIENCFYALNQQYDITRNGTTVITKLNNDIITDLPSTYRIEFDMKSSNNPTSNAEQRIYWAPNDLWTGTGQPSLAAFVGYCYSSRLEAGRRLNAQTSETNSKIVTPNEWSHIKINKDENQLYMFHYNEDKTEYSSWSIHGGDNYTDWIFGIILWSNTTFSIKNLKIKSTVPKQIILTLTADKSILSYLDNDTATLTATLTGGSVSGKTVEFFNGTTSLGTSVTDSNGVATKSYASQGVGDVSLTASVGSLVSKIYEICDAWKYGLTSSDTWHNLKSPNVGSVSNGVFTGYNKVLDCDLDWSKDWQIEVDYSQTAYRVGFIILDESMTTSYDTNRYAILLNNMTNAKMRLEYKNSSDTLVYGVNGSANCSFNTFYHLKFVKQGTTISVYYDDILIDSRTNVDNITTANIGVYSWENHNGSIRNLLIKPL